MARPIVFIFFLIFAQLAYAKQLRLDTRSEAAILINAKTGTVLYEKNSRASFYPASITKIATALYVLEKMPYQLDDVVEAPQEALVTVAEEVKKRNDYSTPPFWLVKDGAHIGIKRGEMLSLYDLIRGMLIASGNDAANVIACYVSQSVPIFMEELNLYLQALGCTKTHFCNPHGLHHPDHITTAFDMALMTKRALQFPIFRQIVASTCFQRPKTNKQEATPFMQTNKLLRKGKLYDPRVIGVKTGNTAVAKNTFVAAAEHNGRELIAVLLKVKERDDMFVDATTLFNAAFNQKLVRAVALPKGKQAFSLNLKGASRIVETYLKDDLAYEYYPAEEPEVKCYLIWDSLTPPIQRNQRVGEVIIRGDDGALLAAMPLYADSDSSPTLWYRFFGF